MRRLLRILVLFLVSVAILLIAPLSLMAFSETTDRDRWWSGNRGSAGLAPDPVDEPRAVVQVYGARTIGRRGAFAVHTWVATKRPGAAQYTVHHVLGWRYYRGSSAVVSQQGTPDFHWFGAVPERYVDLRGDDVEPIIDAVEKAVADYPWARRYRAWPGPNSNSFTAFIGREVPALELDLPPTAIGKDYLGDWTFVRPAPSATGWQFSVLGLLGLTL
ncbi:MAG: DUF3750 domain-containing protein, partial [Burkholderiaceae bacterium]